MDIYPLNETLVFILSIEISIIIALIIVIYVFHSREKKLKPKTKSYIVPINKNNKLSVKGTWTYENENSSCEAFLINISDADFHSISFEIAYNEYSIIKIESELVTLKTSFKYSCLKIIHVPIGKARAIILFQDTENMSMKGTFRSDGLIVKVI